MMTSAVVKILEGQLQGITETNIDGKKFYSFLGIPYAKPPLGELRFKAPLPAEPWVGIRDATKEGNICYQKTEFIKGPPYSGSEDCLFLNVFTKTLPEQEQQLKPVMVYIHGGAFISGSASPTMLGAGILLTEDIVLVTMNYRLGVLGFLSLEDPSLNVPGNAGLKDQTLALHWVQKNIKFFNGDPHNVTIFGTSAGAASVHYHILSPASKGLFHKAILHSGVALNPWASSDPEVNTFVKYLNQNPINDKELLDILEKISVEELVEAQNKYSDEKGSVLRIFGPVIEKPNKTEFLTKDPIEIVVSGDYNKLPTIFGFTSNEGLIEEILLAFQKQKSIPIKEQQLEDYIPWQIDLKPNTEAWKMVVEKMRDVYQTEANAENKFLPAGDSLFVAGIIAAAKYQANIQNDPIYLFILSALTGRNMIRQMFNYDVKFGVSHGEDIGYFFTANSLQQSIEKGSQEDIAIRRCVTLWTNFAKYGNPTPNEFDVGIIWKPLEKNTLHFLDIGNELTIGTDYAPERMELWKFIFEQNPKTADLLK